MDIVQKNLKEIINYRLEKLEKIKQSGINPYAYNYAKNHSIQSLIKKGRNKISQKVGEESMELIVDFLNGSKKRTIEEAADLIYHLLVLLYSKKITINDIKKELAKRKSVRR